MLSSSSGKCAWFTGDMSVNASDKFCWLSAVFHHLLFASIFQVNKKWFQILNSINVMALVKWEGHPFSVPPCYVQNFIRWGKTLCHSWNPILCMYLCFSLMQFSKYERVIAFGLQIMKPFIFLLLIYCYCHYVLGEPHCHPLVGRNVAQHISPSVTLMSITLIWRFHFKDCLIPGL